LFDHSGQKTIKLRPETETKQTETEKIRAGSEWFEGSGVKNFEYKNRISW
jgi:hypothetical protein